MGCLCVASFRAKPRALCRGAPPPRRGGLPSWQICAGKSWLSRSLPMKQIPVGDRADGVAGDRMWRHRRPPCGMSRRRHRFSEQWQGQIITRTGLQRPLAKILPSSLHVGPVDVALAPGNPQCCGGCHDTCVPPSVACLVCDTGDLGRPAPPTLVGGQFHVGLQWAKWGRDPGVVLVVSAIGLWLNHLPPPLHLLRCAPGGGGRMSGSGSPGTIGSTRSGAAPA